MTPRDQAELLARRCAKPTDDALELAERIETAVFLYGNSLPETLFEDLSRNMLRFLRRRS